MLEALAVWIIVLITNLGEIFSKPSVDLWAKHLTMSIISLEVVGAYLCADFIRSRHWLATILLT